MSLCVCAYSFIGRFLRLLWSGPEGHCVCRSSSARIVRSPHLQLCSNQMSIKKIYIIYFVDVYIKCGWESIFRCRAAPRLNAAKPYLMFCEGQQNVHSQNNLAWICGNMNNKYGRISWPFSIVYIPIWHDHYYVINLSQWNCAEWHKVQQTPFGRFISEINWWGMRGSHWSGYQTFIYYELLSVI